MSKPSISAERETPIDRWMGWNVQPDSDKSSAEADKSFIDSMSAENYVVVELPKPMGIIFEENDVTAKLNPGGIYVFEVRNAT